MAGEINGRLSCRISGPYQGDFLSGSQTNDTTPLLKGGQVKILAVSSGKRASGAPEVPTVAEAINDPHFDLTLWQGFFAPAGTPKPIVERLNTEINKILASPDMQGKLRDAGADVRIGSPEQFAAFAKAESEKYLQIIQDSGVKPE